MLAWSIHEEWKYKDKIGKIKLLQICLKDFFKFQCILEFGWFFKIIGDGFEKIKYYLLNCRKEVQIKTCSADYKIRLMY